MRVSRRFSRSAAAGAASVLAAFSMTACSSSSSGSASAASSAAEAQSLANANANENDVQVLNSLQLTTPELDSAFATDTEWKNWTDADPSKILLKQAWACTQNIIDTKQQSLQPVTTFFRADQLPGDSVATPGTPTSSSTSSRNSSRKGSTPGTPTSSGSSGSTTTGAADGNPAHWVVSTAIAYQSADAAQAAVNGMGAVNSSPNCGGPSDHKATVGGGIGEVAPSWDNSQGVFVYTDTGSGTTIAVVAQRRGRYVVLTYTRGNAKADAGYYDLEAGPDTSQAADAATAVLGQLTASVVGTGG
jgi:hypothetical protein